jgi:hypothetical protein
MCNISVKFPFDFFNFILLYVRFYVKMAFGLCWYIYSVVILLSIAL